MCGLVARDFGLTQFILVESWSVRYLCCDPMCIWDVCSLCEKDGNPHAFHRHSAMLIVPVHSNVPGTTFTPTPGPRRLPVRVRGFVYISHVLIAWVHNFSVRSCPTVDKASEVATGR